MIIRLVEIPDRGLEIEESLPLNWLERKMDTGDNVIYRPVSDFSVSLKLKKGRKQVHVNGKVRGSVSFQCSRCGQDAEMAVETKISEVFLSSERFRGRERKTIDLEEEDFQAQYFDNDEIDLGQYLVDSIILELPMYPLCNDKDCLGSSGDYSEDWDEPEQEERKEVNPDWQEGLLKVKREFDLNKGSGK